MKTGSGAGKLRSGRGAWACRAILGRSSSVFLPGLSLVGVYHNDTGSHFESLVSCVSGFCAMFFRVNLVQPCILWRVWTKTILPSLMLRCLLCYWSWFSNPWLLPQVFWSFKSTDTSFWLKLFKIVMMLRRFKSTEQLSTIDLAKFWLPILLIRIC